MKALFLTLLLVSTTFAAEDDILDYAAAHPRDSLVKQPDGTMRGPKFPPPGFILLATTSSEAAPSS